MLDYGIQDLQQRLQEGVVILVGEQEARRRHRSKQLQQFGAWSSAKVLHIGCDVVEDG